MPDKKNGTTKKVKFVYRKTENHRNFFIDGAHGGISPRGYLKMQLYSETAHLPKSEILDTSTNETRLEIEEGFLREVEGTIIMDYPVMVQVRDWLNGKIKDFEGKFVPGKKPS